jgi:hypothetical protein
MPSTLTMDKEHIFNATTANGQSAARPHSVVNPWHGVSQASAEFHRKITNHQGVTGCKRHVAQRHVGQVSNSDADLVQPMRDSIVATINITNPHLRQGGCDHADLCCCATHQNTRRDMITTDIAMKAFHPTTPLWRFLMVSLAQTRATRHISRCSSGTRRGRIKLTT